MFHVSEIVQHKNVDHIILKINECSEEYVLWNLDTGAEVKGHLQIKLHADTC